MKPNQESIQPYLTFRDRFNVPIWLGETGENTDQWVQEFRTLLEEHDIGWCFWPYKKMVKTSCVVSVKEPENWKAIVKLGAMPAGTGNAEKRIASRPGVDVCQVALKELLANIRLDKCTVNAGYLKALGLNVPTL
jgi:hypothetical protein